MKNKFIYFILFFFFIYGELSFGQNKRFGLNLNMGIGFENISMFYTTNMQDINLSFGGGTCVGMKYGYAFNKYFELAGDADFQISSLRPLLRNAKSTFTRTIIGITPSLMIPMKGNTIRFKIGAGGDYFLIPQLKIKSSNISEGFNDTWYYSNEFGFHANLVFENDISEKWSYVYGIKYYYVVYEYKFNDNGHYPDYQLSEPDGSGIDIMLGMYYHF